MKKVLPFLLAALTWSCQQQTPKQFFADSPEIAMVKSGNQAYLKGDWETLRSFYADSAMISDNTWTPDTFITAPVFIDRMQTALSDFSEYSISDDAVYNMIINDKGEKWVLCWFNWTGTMKNGKQISGPTHLGFRIVNGKIDFQVLIYDRLPGYLAALPEPAVVAK